MTAGFSVAAATVGTDFGANQDAHDTFTRADNASLLEKIFRSNQGFALVGVADGHGPEGGDMSRFALDTAFDQAREALLEGVGFLAAMEYTRERLTTAVTSFVREQELSEKTGTTLDVFAFRADEYAGLHIGDGRAYALTDRLERLTQEHAGYLVHGLEDPSYELSVFHHRDRSSPRSLGHKTDGIEVLSGRVPRVVAYALATDGLYGAVHEEEMARALRLPAHEAAETIIARVSDPRMVVDIHRHYEPDQPREVLHGEIANADDATIVVARRDT